MTELRVHAAKILMSCDDESGCLVFVDHRLAAVIVRLDGQFHGPDRGRWNLEAGFGPCDARSCAPFDTLAQAIAWVADRVGAPRETATAALKALGDGASEIGSWSAV